MGLIKDGQISGFLPQEEAFAVHYPGYPSSTSRAIQTLGGIEGILKARRSKTNYLELSFRPEDPYSHPALGELRPSSSLLLRISKKKISIVKDATSCDKQRTHSSSEVPNLVPASCLLEPGTGLSTTSPSETCFESDGNSLESHERASLMEPCADIVARVPQGYYFEGMVDYQHVLALHADIARRRKRQWAEVETHFEKGGLLDLNQEDVMLLVPPRFSTKEIPENLVLNQSGSLNSKQNQLAVVKQKWEMDIEPCLAIDFDIEEVPKKINWEDNIPHCSPEWERQMAISKLFEERTIWPRYSVHERLLDNERKVSQEQLKRILFRVGYYFSTGPFGRFWIRKGYDPRKDPEARMYQRVDFRMPPVLRSYVGTDEINDRWKDICQFRVFPSKFFCSFQLFELDDDYIQEEIRKPLENTTFTRSTGWFSKVVFQTLMLRVSMRILSIFPRSGAENLLQSVSKRFEKFKKQCEMRDSILNIEECQSVNPVNRDDDGESYTRPCDIETDGDKDEVEDEECEEEFNEDLIEGDDGFSLQPCDYPLGENVSQDYLQQLFGCLPLGEDQINDFDASDDEYQIYEQDSGENSNSDDEDYDGGD